MLDTRTTVEALTVAVLALSGLLVLGLLVVQLWLRRRLDQQDRRDARVWGALRRIGRALNADLDMTTAELDRTRAEPEKTEDRRGRMGLPTPTGLAPITERNPPDG